MGKRTSDPTGVIGCTEECKKAAMVCKKNHTIVEFRPNRRWKGEFGFDWLRVDDSPVPGHVPGEPPYKDCILGSQKSGYTAATPNAAAYNDLKTEYHKLNVNQHRAAPKDEYFIPWLNLYAQDVSEKINNDYKATNGGTDLPVKPPHEAELRLIINVQGDRKPKELEIVFPSEFLTINGSSDPVKISVADVSFTPNSPGINYDHLPQTIKVACIKEFSKDQYVDVWAHHYEIEQGDVTTLEQENAQLKDTDIPALELEIKALETETQALETEAQALQTQMTEQQVQIQENPADKTAGEIAAMEEVLAAKTAQLAAKKKQIEDKQKEIEQKKKEVEQAQEKITKNTEEINKMQGRSLAGKLCVCANDAKHRKTCKLLLINVRTNFSTATTVAPDVDGVQTNTEIEQFYRALYQALVYPDVERDILFNRTTDPKFKLDTPTTAGFVSTSGIVKYSTISNCFDHMKNEFFKANPTYKAKECYPLFFFGIQGEGMAGVAMLGKKVGAMFMGRVDSTFPHEALHGLGLHHTHMDYNKSAGTYTTPYYSGSIPSNFKYIYFMGSSGHPDSNYDKATSNIMSYKKTTVGMVQVDDRFDTWHWQWEVIRKHL